jgi:hypothetical protein
MLTHYSVFSCKVYQKYIKKIVIKHCHVSRLEYSILNKDANTDVGSQRDNDNQGL